MTIVIDANVFYAYKNSRDGHHNKALNIMTEIFEGRYGEPIILDYVFDEIVSVTMRKLGKTNAVDIGNEILNLDININEIDDISFYEAWQLFKKNNKFNFTDCTIVAFMKIFGINQIATFDKEFNKVKDFEIISS